MESHQSEWIQFLANLEDIQKETKKHHGEDFFWFCEQIFNEKQFRRL